jgi:hypothetical protein
VHGASRRSSALSGSSGDDEPHHEPPLSGERVERLCAICGIDISHRVAHAETCENGAHKRAWHRQREKAEREREGIRCALAEQRQVDAWVKRIQAAVRSDRLAPKLADRLLMAFGCQVEFFALYEDGPSHEWYCQDDYCDHCDSRWCGTYWSCLERWKNGRVRTMKQDEEELTNAGKWDPDLSRSNVVRHLHVGLGELREVA